MKIATNAITAMSNSRANSNSENMIPSVPTKKCLQGKLKWSERVSDIHDCFSIDRVPFILHCVANNAVAAQQKSNDDNQQPNNTNEMKETNQQQENDANTKKKQQGTSFRYITIYTL